MYLALSAAGEGRQQMGAIVPVGINRADVWVDTPLEARVVKPTPSLRGKNGFGIDDGNIPGILPNNQFSNGWVFWGETSHFLCKDLGNHPFETNHF